MAEQKNKSSKRLLVGAGVIGGGFLLYELFFNKGTAIPPGYTAGGFTNNTGATMYLQAGKGIVDSLGNLVKSISQLTTSSGGSSDGGNQTIVITPPSGGYNIYTDPNQASDTPSAPEDTGGGSQTIDTSGGSSFFGGSKMGCNCHSGIGKTIGNQYDDHGHITKLYRVVKPFQLSITETNWEEFISLATGDFVYGIPIANPWDGSPSLLIQVSYNSGAGMLDAQFYPPITDFAMPKLPGNLPSAQAYKRGSSRMYASRTRSGF